MGRGIWKKKRSRSRSRQGNGVLLHIIVQYLPPNPPSGSGLTRDNPKPTILRNIFPPRAPPLFFSFFCNKILTISCKGQIPKQRSDQFPVPQRPLCVSRLTVQVVIYSLNRREIPEGINGNASHPGYHVDKHCRRDHTVLIYSYDRRDTGGDTRHY